MLTSRLGRTTRSLKYSKRHFSNSYLIRTSNVQLEIIVRFISKTKGIILIASRGY